MIGIQNAQNQSEGASRWLWSNQKASMRLIEWILWLVLRFMTAKDFVQTASMSSMEDQCRHVQRVWTTEQDADFTQWTSKQMMENLTRTNDWNEPLCPVAQNKKQGVYTIGSILWLGHKWRKIMRKKLIPYPLRALKISVEFNPFGFWLKPSFTKRNITEEAKREGNAWCWFRWGQIQISISRWL